MYLRTAALLLLVTVCHAQRGGGRGNSGNNPGRAPATNPGQAKKNALGATDCNGSGRQCKMNIDDLDLETAAGDIVELDLGMDRTYECKSMGMPEGNGATLHAECSHGDKAGTLNMISAGMDADGKHGLVTGTMGMDDEVCRIYPDADRKGTTMDCIPRGDLPQEGFIEPATEVPIAPPGSEAEKELAKKMTDKLEKGLRGGLQVKAGQDDGSVMDLMVPWSMDAECGASGLPAGCTLDDNTEANMRALVDLAVAETNTAYTMSGIQSQLRLVHAYRVTLADSNYVESSTTASSVFNDALNQLRNMGDGILDEAHTLRETFQADIVAMLIDGNPNQTGVCGLGFVGPRIDLMFTVTSFDCATGSFSFGHEIGHNMGCLHDRGNAQACGSTDFNFGYRDPQGRFRSIMSTFCSQNECDANPGGPCVRQQLFSTPNVLVQGDPIGTVGDDNARVHNENRIEVAQYFDSIPDCSTDADCDDADPCTIDTCGPGGICTFAPMCDDDNMCTTDTCNAGVCTFTDISASCDDGNPCTTDTCGATEGCINTPDTGNTCSDGNDCTLDTCNIFGGCDSTPIANCCGNNICDAGEADTCPQDCSEGPFTLGLGSGDSGPQCASCFGLDGNMFDVVAGPNNDIWISAVNIFYFSGAIGEVYTREGTHMGNEFSSAGWTLVATQDFTGSGSFTTVPFSEMSFTETVSIPAGTRRAFYVTLQTDGTVLYDNAGSSSLESVVASDMDLTIFEGPAKVYPFGGQTGPRRFNGQFVYTRTSAAADISTPDPTPEPTEPPTPAPTPAPTPSPTFFHCNQFNEDACADAYGGGMCQWIGDCQNCGCVPTPKLLALMS